MLSAPGRWGLISSILWWGPAFSCCRVTRSGGAYAYIEEAFGPFAGFIAAVLFWFGWSVLADAALTVAMVETIAIGFPVLLNPFARALFIIGLFTFLVVVNVLGVESGVRLYVFNTMVKLAPLLLLVIVGLFSMNSVPVARSKTRQRQCLGGSWLG